MRKISVLAVCILMGFVAAAQDTEPAVPVTSDLEESTDVERPQSDWVDKTNTISPDSRIGQKALDGAKQYLSGTNTDSSAGSAFGDGSPDNRASLGKAVTRMISALAIVLALILGLYYFTRKFGSKVPVFAGSQFGKVLGRIHLSKDASLHYVQTGGRVLLVGVTNGGVQLVAEFDSSAFDEIIQGDLDKEDLDPEKFLAHLNQQTSEFNLEKEPNTTEDDISALRSDIRRLQDYLQEEASDPKE
jgi:flagellar biosynthetic protein FliO